MANPARISDALQVTATVDLSSAAPAALNGERAFRRTLKLNNVQTDRPRAAVGTTPSIDYYYKTLRDINYDIYAQQYSTHPTNSGAGSTNDSFGMNQFKIAIGATGGTTADTDTDNAKKNAVTNWPNGAGRPVWRNTSTKTQKVIAGGVELEQGDAEGLDTLRVIWLLEFTFTVARSGDITTSYTFKNPEHYNNGNGDATLNADTCTTGNINLNPLKVDFAQINWDSPGTGFGSTTAEEIAATSDFNPQAAKPSNADDVANASVNLDAVVDAFGPSAASMAGAYDNTNVMSGLISTFEAIPPKPDSSFTKHLIYLEEEAIRDTLQADHTFTDGEVKAQAHAAITAADRVKHPLREGARLVSSASDTFTVQLTESQLGKWGGQLRDLVNPAHKHYMIVQQCALAYSNKP